MMTCREVYSFLDDYLDGVLGFKTRWLFSAHLLLCSACRRYLSTYRASIQAARGAEQAEATPEPIPEELIAIILASRKAAVPEHEGG